MTIHLQLKPEIEARIIAEAAAQALSVEAYLASLIEESLTIKRFSAIVVVDPRNVTPQS
jgi:hypothetical protein